LPQERSPFAFWQFEPRLSNERQHLQLYFPIRLDPDTSLGNPKGNLPPLNSDKLPAMRILLAVCFLSLGAPQAIAQLTVKEYQARMSPDDLNRVTMTKWYVKGLAEGMTWANINLTLRNSPPLFCLPDKLALGVDNFLDIIDRRVKQLKESGKKTDDTEVGIILLGGLEDTFPCPAK